jgi:hypothetical protein
MEFGILEIVQGSLSLVYIFITLLLSVLFIIKYIQIRQTELLLVGIALIGLAGPWFTEAFSFLTIILTGGALSDGFYLNIVIIIYIIMTAFTPFAIMCWLFAITKLLDIKNRKKVLLTFINVFILFEVIFFVLLFTDIAYIGTFIDLFNYQESLFVSVFNIAVMLVVLITGILFFRASVRSEKDEIKLKGRLILIGLILFMIGGFTPYIIFSLVSLVIARIFLVFSSVTLYMGFLLPNWVKKLFKIT